MTDATITSYGEENLATPPEYIYFTPGTRSAIAGFTMVPHAQAFADACMEATGARSFGTYIGHSPSVDRAMDIFTPVPSDRRSPNALKLKRVLGDDIADFALETLNNGNPYGIDYWIWRQHIYNPDIADYWRLMEDRGGVTNNHFDHCHGSFNARVDGPLPAPTPKPTPVPDIKEMSTMTFLFGVLSGEQKGQVWLWDSPGRIFTYVGDGSAQKAIMVAGVEYVGDYQWTVWEYFRGLAENAGFTG